MKTFPIEPKANCTKCGMSILLTTFERTEGRCMPCAWKEGYQPAAPPTVPSEPLHPDDAYRCDLVRRAIERVGEVHLNCVDPDGPPESESELVTLNERGAWFSANTRKSRPLPSLLRVLGERLEARRPTGYLCLTETPLDLLLCLFGWQAGVPLGNLLAGQVDEGMIHLLSFVADELSGAPFFLCGRAELVQDGLLATLHRWHTEHGVQMLLVDSPTPLIAQFPNAVVELKGFAADTSVTVLFPG